MPAPLARGRHGAVVAPHHLATAAGLGILRAGGSAVDAAIATNAALAVVMPNGCGIGGDAFWLIWDAAAGRQTALNGSGRAPAAADAAAWRRAGRRDRCRSSARARSRRPGAVRSWSAAHARHGRLSREAILAPGHRARRGRVPGLDGYIAAVEVERRHAMRASDDLPDRGCRLGVRPPTERPPLATRRESSACRRSAGRSSGSRAAGFDDLYEGDLAARQAAAASPRPARRITAADLRAQGATWEEPIGLDYRGVRATTHPPNSSGVVALEILGLLARFEPPGTERLRPGRRRPTPAGSISASRPPSSRWPTATPSSPIRRSPTTPTGWLLSDENLAALAACIDEGGRPRRPHALVPRGGGTIYLAVVDGEGNAVSLIQSNYKGFGSGVLDPATGIHYHDRGSFFTLLEGHPNELAPGKRPLHTLLPGMLFRDGRPWVVAGSMGGDAQPQIHAQVVSALVDGGVDVATAVGAPRWFVEPEEHFAPPVDVRLEPRFAPGIAAALARPRPSGDRGRPFVGLLGHCHAIELVAGGAAEADGFACRRDRSAQRGAAGRLVTPLGGCRRSAEGHRKDRASGPHGGAESLAKFVLTVASPQFRC